MARETYDTEPTGWTGWIAFAGFLLILGGFLHACSGLVGILNDDWVGFTNRDNAFLDVQAWGWVALIVGTIVCISGFGVLTGNILARTVGVIVAALSLIANFFYIPVYPIWALIIITIDVLIIWALTAHGKEMKTLD